jgi:hypothetical protein
MDAKFVLSGSDDGNIRLWKANASEKLGVKSNREQNAVDYAKQVKERFKHMPEIKRIDKWVDLKRVAIAVSNFLCPDTDTSRNPSSRRSKKSVTLCRRKKGSGTMCGNIRTAARSEPRSESGRSWKSRTNWREVAVAISSLKILERATYVHGVEVTELSNKVHLEVKLGKHF